MYTSVRVVLARFKVGVVVKLERNNNCERWRLSLYKKAWIFACLVSSLRA